MVRTQLGASVRREMLLAAFVVIGLPLLGGIAYNVIRERRTDAEYARVAATLPAELAAARREGIPLDPADLRRNPTVPDAQNAAPLLEQALAAQRSAPSLPSKWKPAGAHAAQLWALSPETAILETTRHRLTGIDMQRARAYLRLHATQLRLADTAARLPYCDFHRQYELGPSMLYPEYAPIRELARLLTLRAAVESDEGHPIEALHTVTTIARLGNLVGQEPMLIPYLVHSAILQIGDGASRRVVLRYGDQPGVLTVALATSVELERRADLAQAISGELVSLRITLGMIKRDPSGVSALGTGLEGLETRMHSQQFRDNVCRAWEARAVGYVREVVRLSREMRNDPVALSGRLKALEDGLDDDEHKPTYELGGSLFPSYSQAELTVAKARELGRLRRTVLDIVEYRQKHGRYPASLAELSRVQEPDIFAGKPPIYRMQPGGFLLYSVGQDFKDDGGVTYNPTTKGRDIVVRWPPKL